MKCLCTIESLITTKGMIMTNISTEVAERIARLETKVDILVDTQRLLVDQMREALELQRAIRDLEAKDKEHMDAFKRLHARLDESDSSLKELREEQIKWRAKAAVVLTLVSIVGPMIVGQVLKMVGIG